MNSSVQPLNENVQLLNESVQSLNPHTPIYINKEKREEYNASCDTIAPTNPSTPSSFNKSLSLFDELLVAYKSNNANINPSPEILAMVVGLSLGDGRVMLARLSRQSSDYPMKKKPKRLTKSGASRG